MSYLMFQLYGALQAWGTATPGMLRPTADHPTKSGVVGLLAACKGIPASEEQLIKELFSSVEFACRTDIPGTFLEDYHTIGRDYRDGIIPFENPIQTWRHYLVGALFTIAIKGDEPRLSDLAKALQKPIFMPYLGRASCLPGLPFHPIMVEKGNLREAFKEYIPDHKGLLRTPRDPSPKVHWEWEDNSIEVIDTLFSYDYPKNIKAHTFGRRREYEGRL